MKLHGYLPDPLEICCGRRLQYKTFCPLTVELKKVNSLKVVAIYDFLQGCGRNFNRGLGLVIAGDEVIYVRARLILFDLCGQNLIGQQVLLSVRSIEKEFC